MPAHNLPPQPTPFIGRAAEVAEIVRLLSDPACNLLTLVGPGGMGKTRLALEVGSQLALPARTPAPQFPEGVYFVPLQPLIAPDLILSAIAAALKFPFSAEGEPEAQLIRHLRSRTLLLILDNFEHVLAGAALISRLLTEAPRVKLLVTSRETLNLREEWLYTVYGLAFPTHSDTTASHTRINIDQDAVQLFSAAARRQQPNLDFSRELQHIARICRLVEGMPLALEMAASWVRVLSCAEIADELERSLDFLEVRASNVPARHQNLRHLLDQAWQMLTEDEQRVFRMLSVFRGGFTRAAAQEVVRATVPILAALVDKSWLRHQAAGRYDIHELLRQYGQQRLAELPEEVQQIQDRHCAFYAELLRQQWKKRRSGEQIAAREEFETELDNVRVCWEHAVRHWRLTELEAAFYTLWNMYDDGGRYQEAEQAFGKAADALRLHDPGTDTELMFAKILMIQGQICFSFVRLIEGEKLLRQSLAILKHYDHCPELVECLAALAQNLFGQPDRIAEARQLAEQTQEAALAIGDAADAGLSTAYALLAGMYSAAGNFQRAWQLQQQCLALALKLNDERYVADSYAELCLLAARMGIFDEAYHYGELSLRTYQQLNVAWGIARVQQTFAVVAFYAGDFQRVERQLLEALSFAAPRHLNANLAPCLTQVAELRSTQGKLEEAVELYCVSEQYLFASASPDRAIKLAALQAQMPADSFAAAVQRGKALDFEVAVERVIAQLQAQPISQTNLLTARELEVLRLLASGRSNREIADQLVLALGTVKWYISDIFSKLNVTSRTQAVARARELNILSNRTSY